MKRIRLVWIVVLAALFSGLSLAQQQYPGKTVRLIVPYPPAAARIQSRAS
jgi:hypothetical protein